MCKKRSLFLLVLVTMSFLFVMFSCNKDTDSDSSNTELPPPEPFTEEEQQQMANAREVAISTYMAAYETEGPVAAGATTVEATAQLPGVEVCAASDDGSTVWIRFTNGVLFCIAQLPDQGSLPPELSVIGQTIKAAHDISDFPEGIGTARVFCSDDDPISTAAGNCFIQRLGGIGYNLDNNTYRGLNFDPLTLSDAIGISKIMMFASHGTLLEEASPFETMVGIVTSIPQSPENEQKYSALERNQDVQFVHFTDGTTSLVILPKYVRDHCSFSSDALVFGNFCYSAAPSSDWSDAILSKGAAVFVGWDDTVLIGTAIVTGNGLADLLTGNRSENTLIGGISLPMMYGITLPIDVTNQELPVNIGNAAIILDLLGITNRYGNIAKLVIKGDKKWGLRPHLDGYTINSTELILRGSFGSEKGEVKIENESGTPITSLSVISWSESEIRCQKPQGNLTGNLVVYARGLKSNPRLYASGQWILNWGNSGTQYFAYSDSWHTTSAVMTPDGNLFIIFNASTTPMAHATVENFASVALGTSVECSMFISYSDNYAISPFCFSDSDPWLRTYVTFTQNDLTPMGKISGSFSGKLGIYHPLDPFNWETVDIISAPFTVTYLGQGN